MFGGGRSVLLDDMSLIKGGENLENMRTVSPATWVVVKRAGTVERQVKRSTDERSALRQALSRTLPGSPARLSARNVSDPDLIPVFGTTASTVTYSNSNRSLD
jgi:hypothetical protein